MTLAPRRRRLPRALAVIVPVGAALALSTGSSSGDLRSQIDASKSAAAALRTEIARDSARITATTGGLNEARARLAALQHDLDAREDQLRSVQTALVAARDRLVYLENRMHQATQALAANLVSEYEGSRPDLVSVILDAHGFSDLLEQVSFMQRVGRQDAQIVSNTRTARADVSHEANRLVTLEQRDRVLTVQILAQRNHVGDRSRPSAGWMMR